MNLNFGKTALLAGVCSVFSLGYTPQLFAASAIDAVEAVQQAKKVTGTVTDAMGPVIGANILIKGTTKGVITDIDGNFSIEVEPGATLVVSFIGYTSQEIVVDDRNVYNITMSEDTEMLDEVVVVGYGTMKKKLVTGATVQVKGEEIAKMNTTNALSALQSSSPGVQITQASSQPGKGFKVSIRGVGTIGESSPLLIIDGVNSGTANDGLNSLNPNDIESIDILKDAASAAIYGARAANGVILVTTKQGKAGKLTVQYDGYVGWSNAYKVPGLLNAQQYMQVINETNFNTYGTATNWASLVPQRILDKVANGWQGTDWFKEYENKNALQMNHSISVTGGSERSKFSMSFNYSSNEGIMGRDNASDYSRYGGRINSEHIVLKGDDDRSIITLGENVSYWYNSSHDLPEGSGSWNIMNYAYQASPLVEAWDEDGNLTGYNTHGAGYSSMIYMQPLNGFMNGQYQSMNRTRNFGVGATLYWIIEPIKGLKYRGQLNTGYSGSNYRSESTPFSVSSTASSDSYELQQSQSASSSMALDNTITYTLPELNGHNIDVMVGQSFEKSNWSTSMSMQARDASGNVNSLVLNGWNYAVMSNFSNIVGYSGTDTPGQGSIASFFGRVNWNYKEKYMATVTMRADGSSNFARGNRWGYFPSVSAGWVVTSEKFMESTQSWLDYFKIRASWGQNGNCNIGNFYYLSNMGFSPTNYADYGYKFSSDLLNTVNGVYTTGAYARNVPNEDVTWETSEQLNIGVDARFLASRLSLTFDWYKKTTKDWLVQAPMNDILGYEEPAMVNGGDVVNKGIELGIGWNDNIGKDFSYHVNANVAYNKNEVTRLATASGQIGTDQTSALFQNSSYVSLVEVGHPIGYFSGMSYSGIWQNQAQIDAARAEGKAVLPNAQPGDMIWDDYNGDGSITLDGDRHEIGDPNPDVTLGLSLGFSWKGLDFNVTGAGAFGHQIMQCYRTSLLANQYTNYTTDFLDRWHGEGTSNTQPRLVVGTENNQWVSTRYMQDGNYFRIQNITLGYDFCKLWKNSPFQMLRLYVQGQNLFTFTGYTGLDPEVGSNGGGNYSWARGIDVGLYPSARTYIVGVSVKF
ncbi:MAG TPA: TonB-dependent receptor [Candidatus Bacteroides merdigallinarum]|uniref:TonB-dependent receptor n=1 Tax=Candidatus Bacteroides merdigallinarum TaxID=2838473 RepID=A0A9D2E700_9BACE|nr:TonB-dependent receptor [Candidatus Bacteroides merdigallinarum]